MRWAVVSQAGHVGMIWILVVLQFNKGINIAHRIRKSQRRQSTNRVVTSANLDYEEKPSVRLRSGAITGWTRQVSDGKSRQPNGPDVSLFAVEFMVIACTCFFCYAFWVG